MLPPPAQDAFDIVAFMNKIYEIRKVHPQLEILYARSY